MKDGENAANKFSKKNPGACPNRLHWFVIQV